LFRPCDIDFRAELNRPEWTVEELERLIGICNEKIHQLRTTGANNARHNR